MNPTLSATSPERPLSTIKEYSDFVRRRLRIIVAGTLLAVAVSAIMSIAIPDVYAAWIVIDAGTLASRNKSEVDVFRGEFNGGAYHRAIADFPRGSIMKAWMDFDPPTITIRVDATTGASAAAGATRVAEYVIAELSKNPRFRPEDLMRLRATAADLAEIHASFDTLHSWIERAIADAESVSRRLTGERSRLLSEIRALEVGDATESHHRKALVDRLSILIDESDHVLRQIRSLETSGLRVEALQAREFSQGAIPALRRTLGASPHSAEHLVEMIKTLTRQATERPTTPPLELSSMQIISTPDAPATSRWPNRVLIIVIAALFGLVGSSFAAVIVEHKE